MLSVEFYQLCKKVKLDRDQYDQLKRASASICRNLSEGYGKPTFNDQRKYFYIAMGSLRECESILLMEMINDSKILSTIDCLEGSLFKLCNSNTTYLKK